MTSHAKVSQCEGFTENSFNAFDTPMPLTNKSNARVNDSDNPQSPKIYTNSLNHKKGTESVSSFVTQELNEKENGNYLDSDVHGNLKSPECENSANESFPSLTASKLRRMDNEELKSLHGSIGENGVKGQAWEQQASGLAQCTEELDEELGMINDHWKGIFSDIEKFEKSCFGILDDLIEKAENLEKSWKMQKEMLGQRLKNLSKTFEL